MLNSYNVVYVSYLQVDGNNSALQRVPSQPNTSIATGNSTANAAPSTTADDKDTFRAPRGRLSAAGSRPVVSTSIPSYRHSHSGSTETAINAVVAVISQLESNSSSAGALLEVFSFVLSIL